MNSSNEGIFLVFHVSASNRIFQTINLVTFEVTKLYHTLSEPKVDHLVFSPFPLLFHYYLGFFPIICLTKILI